MEKLNTSFMQFLFDDLPHNQRLHAIKFATEDQLKSIVELIYNLLIGNIPVTTEEISLLKKHKSFLYKLVQNKSNPNKIRGLLCKNYNTFVHLLRLLESWVSEHVFGSSNLQNVDI